MYQTDRQSFFRLNNVLSDKCDAYIFGNIRNSLIEFWVTLQQMNREKIQITSHVHHTHRKTNYF